MPVAYISRTLVASTAETRAACSVGVVGRVTADGRMRVRWHGEQVVDIPVAPVAHQSPELDRPVREPADRLERQKLDPSGIAPEADLAVDCFPDLRFLQAEGEFELRAHPADETRQV